MIPEPGRTGTEELAWIIHEEEPFGALRLLEPQWGDLTKPRPADWVDKTTVSSPPGKGDRRGIEEGIET